MPFNVIDKLSDPTIKSKIELIKYLIERAEKQKSNKEFATLISDYLFKKEKIPYLGNYCQIGPKYALGCLIAHFLYHYCLADTFEKQIELLRELQSLINGFQPSDAPLLKLTTTIKLINLISEFGIPEYYLTNRKNGRPLRIYYIPYKHTEANALYYPYINSIASYRPKEGFAPEYIFLHEIGHLLAFNLTNDLTKVPNSFLEFNKEFNPDWKGDLAEVFADLFSMSVMMETEYASKNPFLSQFQVQDQRTIRKYFYKLTRNINGRNLI